jgi:hypothetical protein
MEHYTCACITLAILCVFARDHKLSFQFEVLPLSSPSPLCRRKTIVGAKKFNTFSEKKVFFIKNYGKFSHNLPWNLWLIVIAKRATEETKLEIIVFGSKELLAETEWHLRNVLFMGKHLIHLS